MTQQHEHKDSSPDSPKGKADKRSREKNSGVKKPRRWPWFLTFLLASGSAGGVWYLWQEHQVLSRSIALSSQQTLSDINRNNESLKQQLADSNNELALLKQSLLAMQGKDNMDWLVSEAEYLIRIASHRLLLERDVKSALAALRSADARLFESQDPYWIPVRNQLARDIGTLEAIPELDSAGLSLRISNLGEAILLMPILKPERSAPSTLESVTREEPKPEARYWSEVWDDLMARLSRLITIRKVERQPGPLLAPDQAAYLQQNLLLKLEGARLAMLRGEESLYRNSLKEARMWIETFYDTASPATRDVLKHLTVLHEMQVAPALPDISQSLAALQQTRLKRARTAQQGGK